MRTPSFTVVANVPSAFLGNKSKKVVARPMGYVVARPRGSVVARPAGQAQIGQTNLNGDVIAANDCINNTYHGVRFYDANQNCLNINNTITTQAYNEYGYPIDQNGNPEMGVTIASWALIGTQGQAWVQPLTGRLLDSSGNWITPTSTPSNTVFVTPRSTTSAGTGGTPAINGALAGANIFGTPATGGTNWPLIGAAALLGLVSIVVLVRNQQAAPVRAAAVRRSPAKRSSGRRAARRRS